MTTATMQFHFDASATPFDELSDAEFLACIGWQTSAPDELRRAAESSDIDAVIAQLRRLPSLQPGRKEKKFANQGLTPPLLQVLWSKHAFDTSDTTSATINLLIAGHAARFRDQSTGPSKKLSTQVDDWLEALRAVPSIGPFDLLAGTVLLPRLAQRLTDDTLWNLWRTVLSGCILLPSADDPVADLAEPDQRLLVCGELPWRIGGLFPEVKSSSARREAGREFLRRSLDDHTDTDGTPRAALLGRFPLWLACLSRSAGIAREEKIELWDEESTARFEATARQAAALCHADGHLAMSNGTGYACVSLVRTTLKLAGLRKKQPPLKYLNAYDDRDLIDDLPGRSQDIGRGELPVTFRRKHRPVAQSDWAEFALLRSNWMTGADSCAVTHDGRTPSVELTAFDRRVLSGTGTLEVSIDDRPLEIPDEWQCVCWFSDKDADYLELQCETEEGTRLNRQVLLSRDDHFLFLADSIVTDEPGTIRLRSRLPIAEGIAATTDVPTRECQLKAKRLCVRAYPLGLIEDRVQSSPGALEVDGDALVLSEVAPGGGLYAPLLFDWSPDRRRSNADWMKVTVAEDGERLGTDRAAGYRLRVGKHQWFVYRSLRKGVMGRSMLGHHTLHETVIGEFTSNGVVEPLVLVE